VSFETIANFLTVLASGLLVIALPIVIAAAVQHYRVMTDRLTAGLSADQRELLVQAIKLAVQVAEQSGVLEGLLGEEKRQRAIQYAQDWLLQRGINIDVGMLVDLIEDEVRRQFNDPTPLPSVNDAAANALARQKLINESIEKAILAAEQSGLTGEIANTISSKKAYAADIVAKFLQPYGIHVDPKLASGLVGAELMRTSMMDESTLPQ